MSENMYSPPYSNTGAQNTTREGLRACVDWLQVTFKFVTDPTEIIDFLYLNLNDFQILEHGKYGYRDQLRFNDIAIYYNGRSDMGCHLELTGQGCRQFESISKLNWSELLSMIIEFQEVNITRIDLAIDDFKGYFTVNQAINKAKRGHIASSFKSARNMEKWQLKDGSSEGNTLYFGSPSSRIQIRIYDKKLEREGKNKEVTVEHWVRTEIQARKDRAQAIATVIAFTNQETGQIASGILKNYLRFLVENKEEKNKSRWKTVKWWENFLGDVEKLKLTQVAPDYTIERANDWVKRQVTPTLAMLLKAFDYDTDLLINWLDDGEDRLQEKHYQALELFRNECREFIEQNTIQTKVNLVNELREFKYNKMKNKKSTTKNYDTLDD